MSSRRALIAAADIAKLNDDDIHSAHVWENLRPAMYAHSPVSRSPSLHEAAAWDLVGAEVSRSNVASGSIHAVVCEGGPSAVLIELAANARILALGTGSSHLTETGQLGSVALDVVRHAPCPVLLVPA